MGKVTGIVRQKAREGERDRQTDRGCRWNKGKKKDHVKKKKMSYCIVGKNKDAKK